MLNNIIFLYVHVLKIIMLFNQAFLLLLWFQDDTDGSDNCLVKTPVDKLMTLTEPIVEKLVKQASLDRDTRDVLEYVDWYDCLVSIPKSLDSKYYPPPPR